MFDIIGDLHGHYDELLALLDLLGYRKHSGAYRHPDIGRRVLFLGDYIDRGPQIREVVTAVRAMVEADTARAIMGNHEYNALAFHTYADGRWMRSRSDVHLRQHLETLYQYRNHHDEWTSVLEWIRGLPLYYEDHLFRAVHASWIPSHIDSLRKNPRPLSSEQFLIRSSTRGSSEYQLIEGLLKGVEISLPDGTTICDKEGVRRSRTRVRWWLTSADPIRSYRDIVMPPIESVPDVPLPAHVSGLLPGYDNVKPVFFGHYWLTGPPRRFTPRVACLDYSVAKSGQLAAYRFDGNPDIEPDQFVSVPAQPD